MPFYLDGHPECAVTQQGDGDRGEHQNKRETACMESECAGKGAGACTRQNELAGLFSVGRPTVYRAIERAQRKRAVPCTPDIRAGDCDQSAQLDSENDPPTGLDLYWNCLTKQCIICLMTVVNFRTDERSERALAELTADGATVSDAIRRALVDAARLRRREQMRRESLEVSRSADDLAESRAVQQEMDEIRAW